MQGRGGKPPAPPAGVLGCLLPCLAARLPPHCGAAAVKPETWAEMVSCLRQAEAVNQKLFMDHIDGQNALFRVSFLSDHQFYRPDLI